MEKSIINYQINKIPSFFYLSNESILNSFDFSYDDDLNKTKNNDEFILNNFDTEFKTSKIKEEKTNSNNLVYNMNKISKFNFNIINNKRTHNVINKNQKVKEVNKEKNIYLLKKRGRKMKNKIFEINNNNPKIQQKVHDKFSDDNMRKKCKNIILKYLFQFINNKIKELYKGQIGHGDFKKELKILSQERKVNSTIELDKDFLNKKLIDIFSENISSRISNFSLTHNKTVIESLINEEDEEKREYFTKLFNIKFLDCLKYFTGKITFY